MGKKVQYDFYAEKMPPIGEWDEYDRQWKKHFDTELKKSDVLSKGIVIGKLFSIGVADGAAYYEIVKVFKKTVKIKNRPDLCLDKYTDWHLGYGGNFPIHEIDRLIALEEE